MCDTFHSDGVSFMTLWFSNVPYRFCNCEVDKAFKMMKLLLKRMAEAPPPDPEPEPEPEPSSPESIASKSNSVIHRKPSMLVLIKNIGYLH